MFSNQLSFIHPGSAAASVEGVVLKAIAEENSQVTGTSSPISHNNNPEF